MNDETQLFYDELTLCDGIINVDGLVYAIFDYEDDHSWELLGSV